MALMPRAITQGDVGKALSRIPFHAFCRRPAFEGRETIYGFFGIR